MSNETVTRRMALRAGLGLAAGAAAGSLGAAHAAAAQDPTPAQAEGPFFPVREQPDKDADLTRVRGRQHAAQGDVVRVTGTIRDEAGQPVGNALVDVWQANASGRYAHEADPNPAPLDPNFQGWAQLKTDQHGRFALTTIIPGAYPAEEGWRRPPHIHFKVARRGYRELTTQMYFAGNDLNAQDRLLQELPPAEQQRLIVSFARTDGPASPPSGHFDIVIAKVTPA